MGPTILIIGATGNTGAGVIKTLPNLLSANPALANYRILALTRDRTSASAQRLARDHPNIDIAEYDWVELTPSWLIAHEVKRVFLAPHIHPTAFTDESTFHRNALIAGVEYVVRVSTTAANVRPDSLTSHARAHWAVETMLDQPAYDALKWTSLQPNGYYGFFLGSAAKYIEAHRRGEKEVRFSTMMPADAPMAIMDGAEVGNFAAHLLATEDLEPHNKKRYVLNGPEDVTGRQVVDLVEKYTGEKVENLVFHDMSFVDAMAARSPFAKATIVGIKSALDAVVDGKCRASTTSREVLEICSPKITAAEGLEALLAE